MSGNETSSPFGNLPFNIYSQISPQLPEGVREFGEQLASFSKNLVEINQSYGKTLLTLKSPQDWAKAQTEWTQQLSSAVTTGFSKLSEVSTKAAQQATSQVQSQYANMTGGKTR